MDPCTNTNPDNINNPNPTPSTPDAMREDDAVRKIRQLKQSVFSSISPAPAPSSLPLAVQSRQDLAEIFKSAVPDKEILERVSISSLKELGFIPIEEAVQHKRYLLAENLIQADCMISSAAIELAMKNAPNILKLMLEKGTEISKDNLKKPAHFESLKLLYETGNITYLDPYALGNFVYEGNTDAISFFLQKGVILNEYVIHCAENHPDEQRMLLDVLMGDMSRPDISFAYPLAIDLKDKKCIDQLLDKKKPLPDSPRDETLSSAIEKGFDEEIIGKLVDICPNKHLSIILFDNAEVLKKWMPFFLDRGFTLNINALNEIIRLGHDKLLIQLWPTIEAKKGSSCDYLLKAALFTGSVEIFQYCIDKGMKLPENSLSYASRPPKEIFDAILDTPTEIPDDFPTNSLTLNNEEEDLRRIKLLIDRGSQPSSSLVYYTAIRGWEKTIDFLLSNEDTPPPVKDLLDRLLTEDLSQTTKYQNVAIKLMNHFNLFNSFCLRNTSWIKRTLKEKLQQAGVDTKKNGEKICKLLEFASNCQKNASKTKYSREKSLVKDLIAWVKKSINTANRLGLDIEDAGLYNFDYLPTSLPIIEKKYPQVDLDCIFRQLDVESYGPSIGIYRFEEKLYLELLPILKEKAKKEDTHTAEANAYKLSILFDTKEEALAYLNSYQKKNPLSLQPVHDACLFSVPSHGVWNTSFWKNKIKQFDYSPRILSILNNAAVIEEGILGDLPPYELKKSELGKDEKVIKFFEMEIRSLCKSHSQYSHRDPWQAATETFPDDFRSFISKKGGDYQEEVYGQLIKKILNALIEKGGKTIQSNIDNETIAMKKKLAEARKVSRERRKKDTKGKKEIEEISIDSITLTPKQLASIHQNVGKKFLKSNREEFEKMAAIVTTQLTGREQNFPIEKQLRLVAKKQASEEAANRLNAKKPFKELVQFIAYQRKIENYQLKDFFRIITERIYRDIDPKYCDFAMDCAKGGVSKKSFDKAIHLLETHKKTVDYIPDVKIEGKAIGQPAYFLEKMSSKDPYIFILGKMTSCCQSIGDHSNDCVLHGAKQPFGGFYRLMKGKNWVAQCWVGLTEHNELVFDSIEHNQGYPQEVIMEMYALAATDILNRHPRFERVLFGGGGNTPKDHKFPLQKGQPYSRIIGYKDIGYDSKDSRYILAEQGKPDKERLDKVKTLDHSALNEELMPEEAAPVVVRSIDTYIEKGRKRPTLALNHLERNRFFSENPEILKRLMDYEQNPLMEEGFGKKIPSRERYGEPFIPYPMMEEILHLKLKEKKCSYDHLAMANNNNKELTQQLSNIPLKDGENILVGNIEGVHAIAAYIEKKEGEIKVFLADPETPCEESSGIYQAIHEVFPESKAIRMTAKLQIDFYSCSTFFLKAMLYFAKYGRNLFEKIDKSENLQKHDNMNDLLPAKTPAWLLKMAQSALYIEGEESKAKYKIALSKEQLAEEVSSKKKLTLESYLKQYRIKTGSQTYNSAALAAKYRFLGKLASYIKKNNE